MRLFHLRIETGFPSSGVLHAQPKRLAIEEPQDQLVVAARVGVQDTAERNPPPIVPAPGPAGERQVVVFQRRPREEQGRVAEGKPATVRA